MSDTSIEQSVAKEIFDSFLDYINEFKEITDRAVDRFQERDWHGAHNDSLERLNLYKFRSRSCGDRIHKMLDEQVFEKQVWSKIKAEYVNLVIDRIDHEIAETFYNSVCRKKINQEELSNDFMFILSIRDDFKEESSRKLLNTYTGYLSPSKMVRQILEDFKFDIPYVNLKRDVAYIVKAIKEDLFTLYQGGRTSTVEVINSIFYRSKGAYLVGKVHIEGHVLPFILPMLHTKEGIVVDTVILDRDEVSIIFSYTRSYFMVDVSCPAEMVTFLKTLMPFKRAHEIYNALGFNKHGKTVFYRSFLMHLEKSNDKFVVAPGTKGMVMAVFRLPSYNIVFKLIKDKFDPPKSMTKKQVMEKYKLVSEHDRVGRMADTHLFENLVFPKDRFNEELLEELLKVASALVSVDGDNVTIKSLYTERWMQPLNLYLQSASKKDAKRAVIEYGNAIKQLAAANIFPGDMLLKNFGVTRNKRVVFYDYDEICFLTEINFRRMPVARSFDDEFAAEPFFSVGPNDVFPEEFEKFLIGDDEIRAMFFEYHAEIFDVKFWKKMQDRINAGEIVTVYPYRRRQQFRFRFGDHSTSAS